MLRTHVHPRGCGERSDIAPVGLAVAIDVAAADVLRLRRHTEQRQGHQLDVDRIDVYSYIGNQAITTAANPPLAGAPNNGVTNHIAYRGDSFATTKAFDFNGIGTFPLFGRDQTLIVGADYQAVDYDSYYTRLSNYARIDVFNPVSPAEPPLNPTTPP